MTIFDITRLGFRRQKGKKAFLVVAMTLCLTTVLTLFSFVRSQRLEIEREFDEFGANIVITPKTDDITLSYGGVSLTGIVTRLNEIPHAEIAAIRTIHEAKNIRAVSPKIIGVGPIRTATGTRDALLVGVEFDEEEKIKNWWNIDGRYPREADEVLLGYEVATKFGIGRGETIRIGERDFTVAGVVLTTGSQDDNAVVLANSAAGEILGRPGRYSIVEVSALCSDCPIEEIVEQITHVMPSSDVKPLRQVMEQRVRTIAQYERFAFSLLLVLLSLCGLLIFTTVAGSVAERRKEIGIFRAVGFSRRDIMRIILTESLLLSAASGVVATGAAVLALRFVVSGWAGLAPSAISYDPLLFASGFAALVALAFVSSLGPALTASRIDPVRTLASL